MTTTEPRTSGDDQPTEVIPLPDDEARTRPADRAARRPTSVRTRILAAVVALAAVGMAVAGGTAFLLQRERVDELTDDSLRRRIEEFRTLATEGVDPATGGPFTTAEDLMRTAMRRSAPAPVEGLMAVVDGRVALVEPDPVAVRPEDVPQLVAAGVAAQGDTRVRLRTVVTADRSYRYATVPVDVEGDASTGALVVAVDRETAHAELVRTYRTFALVGLAALAVLAAVGWLVAGRLLAPLRALRDTAQRITDTDLSQRIPVHGDDDISELARTVNSMVERLERSFASQRQLLDDAGHELRTPVTIVRGHLEVMDVVDPDDVQQTRRLVLDELDRMQLLVDDLVVLATVERPDFVAPVATDVGVLTDEVLDKARLLGDHAWRVEARADVVVPLDERRVRQAWLQLAANAAKFAPAGSTVRLGSRVIGDEVELWVRDEGPGIPPEHAERVFARFQRGVQGRGVEGSGLGLAIVRAIARAHGGDAFVDPHVTAGARVVVALPLGTPPPDETQEELR
ncbi:HAMP domain-containing sensor histidine kinase [Actinotalea sp. AC32]|nr:HAMP domain-containing sensor histidine kinase [Actinotalea sp. AC32]